MKIGVLSDTHGEVGIFQRAVRILQDRQVDLAIHCGDVGEAIAPLLKGIPSHFVHGNMDDLGRLRQEIVAPEHKLHEPIGSLAIAGRQVAFLHGDDVRLLRQTITSGHWDLVCHGHTHAFSKGYEGRTLVLNPGALARTARPSLAIVDLPTMDIVEIAV
ncbi:MAG: metallophosphoesterase family protein [Thermoguttaceae bacterium]